MQTLHPRFGPWIFGRQKTQNANFASKVWALKFKQAEDPECKLCIQGLGLGFLAGRRPRMQTLHPRFVPWILGRQKTQNANFASKVWALDFCAGRRPRMQTFHPRFGPGL